MPSDEEKHDVTDFCVARERYTYAPTTIDLRAYANQRVTLDWQLVAGTYLHASTWYIDDVSLDPHP